MEDHFLVVQNDLSKREFKSNTLSERVSSIGLLWGRSGWMLMGHLQLDDCVYQGVVIIQKIIENPLSLQSGFIH
jgi:hypothetical protein